MLDTTQIEAVVDFQLRHRTHDMPVELDKEYLRKIGLTEEQIRRLEGER